tara:strand:- start:104 stop:892 length:789 start_codon:yes stop_codon:yes gene_type:complete
MGTKRVGLARTQALIQNLKREITWGAGTKFNGIEIAPNGIATTLLGLNPTWNLNFGGPTIESTAVLLSTANLLTSPTTMFKLSQALETIADQTSLVTAAQAGQIFGVTSAVGSDVVIGTAGATPIPATLTVQRFTGDLASSVAYTQATSNLDSAGDQAMILFTDNVITASQTLKFIMHDDNEFLAGAWEIFVSDTAGTNNLEAEATTTNGHISFTLTASGADTTILAGSYIYFFAGNNTDVMHVKMCLRTSGGTIAVTNANS